MNAHCDNCYCAQRLEQLGQEVEEELSKLGQLGLDKIGRYLVAGGEELRVLVGNALERRKEIDAEREQKRTRLAVARSIKLPRP